MVTVSEIITYGKDRIGPRYLSPVSRRTIPPYLSSCGTQCVPLGQFTSWLPCWAWPCDLLRPMKHEQEVGQTILEWNFSKPLLGLTVATVLLYKNGGFQVGLLFSMGSKEHRLGEQSQVRQCKCVEQENDVSTTEICRLSPHII